MFQGTYAAVGTGGTPAYEYGYGQTAAATYTPGYDQSGANKQATYAATYATQRAASQQAQAAVSYMFFCARRITWVVFNTACDQTPCNIKEPSYNQDVFLKQPIKLGSHTLITNCVI